MISASVLSAVGVMVSGVCCPRWRMSTSSGIVAPRGIA